MLISRGDLSFYAGIHRTILTRQGARGSIPQGTLMRIEGGITTFCYTVAEAELVCDKYGKPSPPPHAFKVKPGPAYEPSAASPARPLASESMSLEDLDPADHQKWHRKIAAAYSLIAEGYKRLGDLGAPVMALPFEDVVTRAMIAAEPDIAVYDPRSRVDERQWLYDQWLITTEERWSDQPLEDLRALVAVRGSLRGKKVTSGVVVSDKPPEAPPAPFHVKQPATEIVEEVMAFRQSLDTPQPDIFAHLDEDARVLAPANLKRGFRILARHDWTYANGLIGGWDGVTMSDAEYSLYASDPDNWNAGADADL